MPEPIEAPLRAPIAADKLSSDSIDQIAAALSRAQATIEGAVKDAKNPFFSSNYADLGSVIAAIRDSFAREKLSYTQGYRLINFEHGEAILSTVLMHASGQWIRFDYPVRPVKGDPQAWGSALTYARRYSLQSIAGVPAVDDDGNEASGRSANQGSETQRKPAEQKQPASNVRARFRTEILKCGWTLELAQKYLKEAHGLGPRDQASDEMLEDVLNFAKQNPPPPAGGQIRKPDVAADFTKEN